MAALSQRRQSHGETIARWCRNHPYLLAVIAITLLAAVVRLYRIESFPPGLHGDEGWTGLDARRVLAEGWIGPYVGSALGQPTGPLYWTAAVFKVIGDGLLQLRLSMALLGIATVPLTYWAARQMFDRRTGLIAAVLMAFMGWHIFFSRTAFMVTAQPLLEVIFLGLLFSAYKRNSYALYASAGVALGLGVYTYNAYPVFVVATVVFAAVLLIAEHRHWRTLAPRLVLMFAVAFVVALPLIGYVRDEKNDYLAHHRAISVLYRPEFKDEDLPGKARMLIDRGIDWAKLMTIEPKVDFTDGTGTAQLVDRMTLCLLLLGVGVCLRRRTPGHLALLVFLLVLPAAAIVTLDASVRRSLGMTPIVAMLAALPLATVWEWAELSGGERRAIARAAIVCVLLAVSIINVRTYFLHVGDSVDAKWVYVEQLAAASQYIETLPDKPYVYFYASRWSYDYETRRYLAPDLKGENRSMEFGKRINAAGKEEPPQVLDFDARVPSVVLLLPAYLDVLNSVIAAYPGGSVHVGHNRQGEVLYVAYTLPTVRR
jgi:4-amino-4-deoxy-L-arabinose transferase-like glycosyltransferase